MLLVGGVAVDEQVDFEGASTQEGEFPFRVKQSLV